MEGHGIMEMPGVLLGLMVPRKAAGLPATRRQTCVLVGGCAAVRDRRGFLVRSVRILVCTLIVPWVFASERLVAAAMDGAEADEVAAASFSGKLTLEFMSSSEEAGGEGMGLGMAFDGKLHLPAGSGMSFDITAGAGPHPASGSLLGYAAIEFAAKPGGGLRLALDARRSRTSEADDPGDPGPERVSSRLRASLAWGSPSGRLSMKVSCEGEESVHPCRPTSDYDRSAVSGQVKVNPAANVWVQADFGFAAKEYLITPRNTSNTTLSSLELGLKRGRNLSGTLKLERKGVCYPGSPRKTYNQHAQEASLSWEPGPGLAVDVVVSQVNKGFPHAREKDLRDRKACVSVSLDGLVADTLTLEGAVFERKVPAFTEKEYRVHSIGAEVKVSPCDRLAVLAGCMLSRRLYLSPAARAGDYSEAEASWKVAYDISDDLAITYRSLVKRREYPLKQTSSMHRLKSTITLVYRF